MLVTRRPWRANGRAPFCARTTVDFPKPATGEPWRRRVAGVDGPLRGVNGGADDFGWRIDDGLTQTAAHGTQQQMD